MDKSKRVVPASPDSPSMESSVTDFVEMLRLCKMLTFISLVWITEGEDESDYIQQRLEKSELAGT